jgi:2,5-diketo-D-gluconate reductase B
LADRTHGATAAQIAIAWLQAQESVITIPKAVRPSSRRANLDARDIRLDDEDRAAIAALSNMGSFSPKSAPVAEPTLQLHQPLGGKADHLTQ